MNVSSLGRGRLRRTLITCAGLVGLVAAGAANATLTASSTSIGFAATQWGATSAANTVTITSSAATTAAPTVALSGTNASSFVLSASTCGTAALKAAGTCTFTISFKPAAVGAATATATVTSGTLTATIALSGTGTSPLTASPTSLSFAGVVGTATAAQTITVKSTAAIAGVAVAISGSGFTQSNTCATSLVANGTCAINVTYTATGTTAATGTVTVSSTTTGVTAVSTTLTGSASAPIPAWETAAPVNGTQTAMFMDGPPMRYPGTTGVAGCGVTTTGGAYVHTTQGGDICAFASKNYAYSYDSSQTGTAYGDYYIYQAAAGTGYTAATDYFGFSVLAPYASANAAIASVSMANSKSMLIKLANMVTPSATNGLANVITVTIKNQGVTGTWPATNPAACSADVTLLTPATGTTAGPGPATFTGTYLGQASGTYVSQTGLLDYVIPFTAFTCLTNDAGTGTATTMAALQATGVTQVAVKVVGSKNPKVVAGSIDAISVGGISFQ